jgi:hypothetical protein
MRFMPIALAAIALALANIAVQSVSESYSHETTVETSEQLANRSGRGTAHRGSGRRAVLAYELPTAEFHG